CLSIYLQKEMLAKLVLLLGFFAIAGAVMQFKQSQFLSEYDLKYNEYANISCPGQGCTLYTTRVKYGDIGIYEGESLLKTLAQIYKKTDGFLVGYHIPPGINYRLKTISAMPTGVIFKVYIVSDSAGIGAVTDTDWTRDIDPKGKRIVTILDSWGHDQLIFSAFKGNVAPKIYTTGFDAINTCSPAYTARSVESAKIDKVLVNTMLATIDFGSTDVSNGYHVYSSFHIGWGFSADIGQSFVMMTPGYTGCQGIFPSSEGQGHGGTYKYQTGPGITKVVVNFVDVHMINNLEVNITYTLQEGGAPRSNSTIVNSLDRPSSYSFVGDTLALDIDYSQCNMDEYFLLQIDFDDDTPPTTSYLITTTSSAMSKTIVTSTATLISTTSSSGRASHVFGFILLLILTFSALQYS
ncbi:hypothetical protein PENTCL1PPCAC_13486, partial [Pristionchus entomophagus]